MSLSKGDRLHVVLAPDEVSIVDDYKYAARLSSRSDAIRQLIKVALNKGPTPPKHTRALKIMDQFHEPADSDGPS